MCSYTYLFCWIFLQLASILSSGQCSGVGHRQSGSPLPFCELPASLSCCWLLGTLLLRGTPELQEIPFFIFFVFNPECFFCLCCFCHCIMLMLAANTIAFMPFHRLSGMQGAILCSHIIDFFPPLHCHGIRDSFPPKRCHRNSSPSSQDSRSFTGTFQLDHRSMVVQVGRGWSVHVGDTVEDTKCTTGIRHPHTQFSRESCRGYKKSRVPDSPWHRIIEAFLRVSFLLIYMQTNDVGIYGESCCTHGSHTSWSCRCSHCQHSQKSWSWPIHNTA